MTLFELINVTIKYIPSGYGSWVEWVHLSNDGTSLLLLYGIEILVNELVTAVRIDTRDFYITAFV